MKKYLQILCVLSGVTGLALLGILCWAWAACMKASVGIIGGAGLPTMLFLLRQMLKEPVFYGMLIALALFVTTLVMLKKKVK